MKRKKIIKAGIIVAIAGVLIGLGVGLYMFYMPHRDVQKSSTDYTLSASELVAEYLNDSEAANKKYLAEDGNSSILEVKGTVARISSNYNGQKVVLLKEATDRAGVNCTFMPNTNTNAEKLNPGDQVTIKGVIRSGPSYDPDLGMYIHAVLDHSDVINYNTAHHY